MTIRKTRYGEPLNVGPGHANPLPANGERHTRGAEYDDSDTWYWQDLADNASEPKQASKRESYQ